MSVLAVAVVALMTASPCPQPADGQCAAITLPTLTDLLHCVDDELPQCESDARWQHEQADAIQAELFARLTAATRRANTLDAALGRAQGPEPVAWFEQPWFVGAVSVVATVAVVVAVQ